MSNFNETVNLLANSEPRAEDAGFIFLLGVGYLGSIIGIEKAISAGFYPFILSEIFKILLAVALIPNITKYLNK